MDEHQSDEDSDRDDACRNEEECAHADRDENDDGDDDQDNGQNDYDAGENTAEDHKYDDAYRNEDDTHLEQSNFSLFLTILKFANNAEICFEYRIPNIDFDLIIK